MNAPLALSPEALAAVSVPEGVEALPIIGRDEWLAWRNDDVTASVAACLFGDCHPYVTAYGLWTLKSGLVKEDPSETPAMRRGRLLEPVALQLLVEECPGWTIAPCRKYYSDPRARLGATPDAFATRPDIPGLGVCQLKTVGKFAFRKGWTDADGDVQIPLWIGVQAAIEAALTGASWACVAAMSLGDGGLDLHVEDVPLHPALMAKLRGLVKDFWRRVEESEPYPPDYGRDAALIARLWDGDKGPVLALGADKEVEKLLDRREALKARESDGAKAAKERKEQVDSQLIHRLGNARAAMLASGRGYAVTTVRKKAYSVAASQYLQISVGTV